jgi:acetyl esterase/lipase
MKTILSFLLWVCLGTGLLAGDPQTIWPDLAPGETTRQRGQIQPFRKGEVPPVTRVMNITLPTFTVHLAPKPNGAGVVILPGGGFGKVVPDKEGTEVAALLNQHGIAAFVLSYRTTSGRSGSGWKRPLQDAQRTVSLVRSRADEWGLKHDRIGLIGFSAGGQVAARLLGAGDGRAYTPLDKIDDVSYRPDFAMLLYPWNIYDPQRGGLIEEIKVPADCPPTFLVHTDDDPVSSLSSVFFYAELKRLGIPSELHIYGNGGHGYGLRPMKGSEIDSWTGHGIHWLERTLTP